MSCRDFVLFGRCNRRNCTYKHELLRCSRIGANCRGSACNRAHLNPEDMECVNLNMRPWPEHVQTEIARVAYIYKRSYPPNLQAKVCTRILTGLNRCMDVCETCKCLEAQDFEKYVDYMRCKVCHLPSIDCVLLNCRHVYHERCLQNLELKTDGALPEYKCAKCRDFRGPDVPVFLTYIDEGPQQL